MWQNSAKYDKLSYNCTDWNGRRHPGLAGREQQLSGLVSYQLQPKLLRSIFLCNQCTKPTNAIGALLHMVAAKSCKVSKGPFTNYVTIRAKMIRSVGQFREVPRYVYLVLNLRKFRKTIKKKKENI